MSWQDAYVIRHNKERGLHVEVNITEGLVPVPQDFPVDIWASSSEIEKQNGKVIKGRCGFCCLDIAELIELNICTSCGLEAWCSRRCKKEAAPVHRMECQLLVRIAAAISCRFGNGPLPTTRLYFRIWSAIELEGMTCFGSMRDGVRLLDNRIIGQTLAEWQSEASRRPTADTYAFLCGTIKDLIRTTGEIDTEYQMEVCIRSLVLWGGEETTKWVENFRGSRNWSKLRSSEAFGARTEATSLIHAITSRVLGCVTMNRFKIGNAGGLCAALSMINHSDDPNHQVELILNKQQAPRLRLLPIEDKLIAGRQEVTLCYTGDVDNLNTVEEVKRYYNIPATSN